MMHEDSPIPGMHPRQAAVLITVPEEARAVVSSRARLLQNLQGGIFSHCLSQAKQDLARCGGDVDALEDMNRRDNHAAMATCAKQGCTACARSTS